MSSSRSQESSISKPHPQKASRVGLGRVLDGNQQIERTEISVIESFAVGETGRPAVLLSVGAWTKAHWLFRCFWLCIIDLFVLVSCALRPQKSAVEHTAVERTVAVVLIGQCARLPSIWYLVRRMSKGNHNIDATTTTATMDDLRAKQLAAVPPFRTGCIVLGFLVGTLIHFSSLGCSYLVTFQRDSAGATDSDILWFSLLWSLLSSSLGVALLVGIRFLVGIADSAVVNMEVLFAFGALNGVSVSWLLIDTLLSGHGQFQVSSVSVVFTAVWFRVLTQLLPEDSIDEAENDDGLSSPLLGSSRTAKGTLDGQKDMTPVVKTMSMSTVRFRVLGLVCGSIIGLFIQFASLGANFVMQQILHDNPRRLLLVSLGWSFLCSTMGIGTLLVIRNMVAAAWPRAGFSFLLTLECFFAIGATLGLNAAWTLTDVVLGFQTHATENLVGLLFTMLWCKLVLCCTSSDLHDDNEDADSETEELLVV